ncbi:MAG: response regulator transcription factor [Ignavibacteriae bacterium]|nr:response regulator transcription factor [Ignavibacteriota bacterium]
MKIFIVDDNAEIRQLVRSVLGNIAEHILEFDNAQNIVALYELHKPDWIIMDIQMQPLNGITATAKLKGKYPDARVVILTNYGAELYRTAAKNAGAHAFFLKDDLRKIRSVFSNTSSPIE